MKTEMIEFENLLETFSKSIDADEFKQLQSDFNYADNIFFIGILIVINSDIIHFHA